MICKKCGSILPDGATSCQVCGQQFQPAAASGNDPNVRGTYVRSGQPNNAPGGYPPGYGSAPAYSAPDYNRGPAHYAPPPKEYVSVGGWIARWLLASIPIVGWLIYFIMLFVWAGNENYETSFRNWAKAQLWIMLFAFILVLLVGVVVLFIALS